MCSLRGRRLKGKGKGVLGVREVRGAREEGGRETPARKPLFSPSRLLIMYAKIMQLWMTCCQISLAAMRLFKSYLAYCFSFVFLKQEIWSKGTIKKSTNAVVRWRKKVATMRGLLYKIQHKSITFLLKVSFWIFTDFPNLHAMFVGEINYKHFADSRTGSSAAYKTTLVAGKEELNFKDLH